MAPSGESGAALRGLLTLVGCHLGVGLWPVLPSRDGGRLKAEGRRRGRSSHCPNGPGSAPFTAAPDGRGCPTGWGWPPCRLAGFSSRRPATAANRCGVLLHCRDCPLGAALPCWYGGTVMLGSFILYFLARTDAPGPRSGFEVLSTFVQRRHGSKSYLGRHVGCSLSVFPLVVTTPGLRTQHRR